MSQTHLIVGASSAIAAPTVQRLLDGGDRVLAASRSSEPVHIAGGQHPLLETIEWDPCASGSAIDLPDSVDGLVYFPGTITLKPFPRLTEDDFLEDYRVNVLGAVHAIQHALPALKKSSQASIVLFSSVAAQTGLAFHASIGAAKAAVEGFGRSLAAELAPKVRVNMIAPSLTDTPLAQSLLGSEERRQAAAERHPLKAIGHPRDTAELVVYLLSSASRFMTGQTLRPDGGLSQIRQF